MVDHLILDGLSFWTDRLDHWEPCDVYQKLESTGLISIGGRGTSLGVGGLVTGG